MDVVTATNTFLPPPKSLHLSGVGVDISECSLKYLSLNFGGVGSSELEISSFGELSLAEGVVSRGEINDVEAVADALKQVKKKTKNSYFRLALPEERVYFFETEVDKAASLNELRHQIEFKLEENVPISPRDAYFDFDLTVGPNTGTWKAIVAVCSKNIVDKYYEACRLASVTPLSFEAESGAIARAILPKNDGRTNLLIDLGRARTSLSIVDNYTLSYTSTIDVGSDNLDSSLRKYWTDKSEEELRVIKHKIGLLKGIEGNNPSEYLLPTISSIKDEIQLRIQYWNEKTGHLNSIENIIICGGGATLRGLPGYLSETLGIETTVADVWQNIFDAKHRVPPINKNDSYGYATAIGLALAPFTNRL